MEVYDSLTERENGVTNDNAVLEDVEEGGDWEQLNESQQTVFDRSFGAEDSVWGERVSNNYLWPWGITDFSRSYSDDKMQVSSVELSYNYSLVMLYSVTQSL